MRRLVYRVVIQQRRLVTLSFHHAMCDCELWAYDGPEELLVTEVSHYTLRYMDLKTENHLYYGCRFGAIELADVNLLVI